MKIILYTRETFYLPKMRIREVNRREKILQRVNICKFLNLNQKCDIQNIKRIQEEGNQK